MHKLRIKINKFKIFLGPEVWNLFILATIVGLLWFLVESGFVVILQAFLSSIGLIDRNKTILPSWFPTEVWATLLILVGFGICRGIVLAIKYFFAISTGQAFIRYQKSQIMEIGLHNAPNMSTSEIMMCYSEHTNTASVALAQMASLINNSVSIALFIFMGFYLAPKEFILSISLLAFALIPIIFLNRKIRGIDVKINTEKEIANKIIVDGLKNNFFLQIYHLIDSEIEKGKTSLQRFETAYMKYGRVAGIRTALPQTAGAIVISLVTYVSLKYFHTSGSKLLSFFYVFIRMAQCSSEFYAVSGDIRIQLVGLKALYFWNEKLNEFRLKSTSKMLIKSSVDLNYAEIVVKNLSFNYKDKKILNELSLSVKNGETLLIRGESGSGKSTLLSLILGLIEPDIGNVTINGHNPYFMRFSLAEKIGYVGPEPYLINGSVRENLLYGHPNRQNVSDVQIWIALERAHLKAEIENLNSKLEENLLERTQFSTGQKQRLSIARALLRNPSILVLDEATANLDPVTEMKIVELLGEVIIDMTTIIVSHKDSFNSLATKKIILKKESI